MSARHYTKTTERVEGQHRSCVRITCRSCGVQKALTMSSFRALPNDVIERKFGEMGWDIGANENRDFCPACNNRRKQKVTLKVVPEKTPPAEDLQQSQPREMGRDDRRLIFAKLDEVYLDERRGYEVGWSDHKVASDLGVPRKWVEVIRAENFGLIGTNEDMSRFLNEAQELLAVARKELEAARAHREAAEKLMAEAKHPNLSDISARLSQVEKLATEVRKLVVLP